MKCPNADDMYFPRLAERVRYLKEDEEGQKEMSSYFEEQRRIAAEKAAEKAEKEAQEGIALRLIRLGEVTLEKIADCTGLTLRRVRALAKTVTP